jgi:probable phosphoglycerate mutase
MNMELILIRHGRPLRVERRDGEPADPDLNEEGRRQAQKMARWLEGERIDAIYSSPLNRAKSTARPLAESKGIDIIIEPGVSEFDTLSSSYIPMEEIKEQDYELWRQLMAGGFADMYDLDTFQKTVVQSLEGIIGDNKSKRVAVVCHGGVINLWTAHVMGLGVSMFFAPEYTSIHRYMAAGAGVRSLITLNSSCHLREDVTIA